MLRASGQNKLPIFIFFSVVVLAFLTNQDKAFAATSLGRARQVVPQDLSYEGPTPSKVVKILTPTDGVNFNLYIGQLLEAVKRNWFSMVPEEAKGKPGIEGSGAKGRGSVRFKIRKNGKLDRKPIVEVSSGKKPLDDAAVAAIRAPAPFERLPEPFKGPLIELRINFLYNLPLLALNP